LTILSEVNRIKILIWATARRNIKYIPAIENERERRRGLKDAVYVWIRANVTAII
jgi:hypothetical protein